MLSRDRGAGATAPARRLGRGCPASPRFLDANAQQAFRVAVAGAPQMINCRTFAKMPALLLNQDFRKCWKMPTGYWHWMKYLEGSYSLSLRAWDASITRKAASLYNLAVKGGIDSVLKMAFKANYANYRERVAVKRANKSLAAGKPY